jgi:hypothetical protein
MALYNLRRFLITKRRKMMKKILILVILAVLSIKCQDPAFLETTPLEDDNQMYLDIQKMVIENINTSIDQYQKSTKAWNDLQQKITTTLRHLQFPTNQCVDCVSYPKPTKCFCATNADCCSTKCRNNYCSPV